MSNFSAPSDFIFNYGVGVRLFVFDVVVWKRVHCKKVYFSKKGGMVSGHMKVYFGNKGGMVSCHMSAGFYYFALSKRE